MLKRSGNNPIISPDDSHDWESRKVYNPAALRENSEYHLFYRAVGRAWISRIGYAYSFDGEKFIRHSDPLFEPTLKIEKKGIEDPRIVKIRNRYYLTYTAYDGLAARLCLATSLELKTWKKHGRMIPGWNLKKAKGFNLKRDPVENNLIAHKEWIKSGAIFPELIGGKYWMIFGDSNLWLAVSDNGLKWQPVWEPFIRPRRKGYFDHIHVEMGPPPIKTEQGWLVLYHGSDRNFIYRLGYLLLDLKDPRKIIKRSKNPIFEPAEPYELIGIVDVMPGGLKSLERLNPQELEKTVQKYKKNGLLPKVVFCCGAVLDGEDLRIYYGAADTSVCTAKARLTDIFSSP